MTSTYANETKMETDEGLNDSGYNTGLNSRESSFDSLNRHSPTNSMGNGYMHQNGLNGVPEIRSENGTGGMKVTATIGTSSPRPRRRGGSRPGSWAGTGVSVTQEVLPGQGHVDTAAATLLRPASGNEGNSRVQANYSVHSNSHNNTNGNVLGHVSIGQVKEEVDQKPQPQQKEPVKPECNGYGRGHHQHGHHNGHHHHHHRPEPPKPVPVPETMDIRVQFFNNNRIKTFTVRVTATVDDLLRAIKEEKCIDMPIDQMRLVYAGKNLERGVKLSRYDIRGTVLLTGRLRGG